MIETCERQLALALAPDDHAAFVRWAYGLFGFVPTADDCERSLFATPYPGCYGHAGYVLTIDGSPPRATILIEPASGRMVALAGDRIVRGSAEVGVSNAASQRYRDSVRWLERLGLAIPERGA